MFDGYKKDDHIPRPVNAKIEVFPKIKLTNSQKQYLLTNCFNWFPVEYAKILKRYSILDSMEVNEFQQDPKFLTGEAFEHFTRCLKIFDPTRTKGLDHITKATDLNKDLDTLARLFASFIKIRTSSMCTRLLDLKKTRLNRCLPEGIDVSSHSFSFIEFDIEDYKHHLITNKKEGEREVREEFDAIHPDLYEYFVKRYIFNLDEAGLNCEFEETYKEIEKTIKQLQGGNYEV